jgi:glycosyltransferase involved in cell wall biosynthesis
MSSKPLVSVVIIFLNAEKFIQESIESVFAQTYDNWELLLVDDGSTDSSTKIAQRYVEQYPEKVRYLEHDGHQNRGMSATRNLGIRNAKGEYIALLDSDDVWLPHKLEQQVAILESQPEAAMVYGPSQKWYSWTGNPEDMQRDTEYKLGVQSNTLIKSPTLLTLSLKGKVITPCPSNILFRREMAERVGGFEENFRSMYQLYEDQAFLAKVHLNESVFVASECWDRYRKHPDSCVAVVSQAGQADSVRLFFLNWLEKYLSEQGIKDTEVWQALKKALWSYRHPLLSRVSGRFQHLTMQMKGMLKRIFRTSPILP